MFKKLTLENFKNFKKAELHLGSFTILVGANATGKSNIREAFRFLHGIGRGYSIPDIIGEKWVEGGVRVWSGIRGGLFEIVYSQPIITKDPFDPPLEEPPQLFSLDVDFDIYSNAVEQNMSYHIEINPDPEPHTHKPTTLLIKKEFLKLDDEQLFQVSHEPPRSSWKLEIGEVGWSEQPGFNSPMLSQIGARWNDWEMMFNGQQFDPSASKKFRGVDQSANKALDKFKSMRFFEFNPELMRIPSIPGQVILGDQGENLSSVLHAICQDEQKKLILTEWLRELTPMDATDFEFTPDQVGRILVTIVEKDGHKTSAYSASDGTLRFLGILAAFLGPNRSKFYFLEELETGIHPTRLHLLTQFIENQVAQGDIQVVATTHSPLLLNYLSQNSLKHVSLLYRLEGHPDAHIKPIMAIPDAQRLVEKQGVVRLYESGWFEDTLYFLDDAKAMPDAEVPV